MFVKLVDTSGKVSEEFCPLSEVERFGLSDTGTPFVIIGGHKREIALSSYKFLLSRIYGAHSGL